MADQSDLIRIGGTASYQFADTVTQTYRVIYDSVPSNYYDALTRAQTASGSPVPARRTLYAGTVVAELYALTISGDLEGNDRTVWLWTVNFGRPPSDEPQDSNFSEADPLNRPAVFNVEYIDREYVISEARNVEALSHGDGKGGARAADTLGPIVNAAGKRPDEPLVETERLEVITIYKNFASLADIIARNRTYKRTTNSDTAEGYSPRELRYLLTESEGERIENGVAFWPGVTRILAEETTDLTLDNVGYEYWSAADADWVKAKDKDGAIMSEPINLKLDGDEGGDNTTTITYRHLSPVAYSSLFT